MNAQIITTPSGERLVILPEADFTALVDAAEDNADRDAVRLFEERLAAGKEELVPIEIADRILAGENKMRIWREHRGLSVSALAAAAGLSQPFISQIEGGQRSAKPETLAAIALALGVEVDDLK